MGAVAVLGVGSLEEAVELEEVVEREEGEVGGEDCVVDVVSSPPIWLLSFSL